MSGKFIKHNGAKLLKTRRGRTMYASVSVYDEMLQVALEAQSLRSGKPVGTCLGQFIQDAFDAGFTPGSTATRK